MGFTFDSEWFTPELLGVPLDGPAGPQLGGVANLCPRVHALQSWYILFL